MTTNEVLEKAFVLKATPYRESSFHLLFYTPNGLQSAIAKGGRSAKDPRKGLLQAFNPLWIQLVGRHELKTLAKVEARALAPNLKGMALFAGFYLNELLMKCLQRSEGTTELFEAYEACLYDLKPIGLRYFEYACLLHIGLAPSLLHTAEGERIEAGKSYVYQENEGFYEALASHRDPIPGRCLRALDEKSLDDADDALLRRLLFNLLAPILEGSVPHSRQWAMSLLQWQKGEKA